MMPWVGLKLKKEHFLNTLNFQLTRRPQPSEPLPRRRLLAPRAAVSLAGRLRLQEQLREVVHPPLQRASGHLSHLPGDSHCPCKGTQQLWSFLNSFFYCLQKISSFFISAHLMKKGGEPMTTLCT